MSLVENAESPPPAPRTNFDPFERVSALAKPGWRSASLFGYGIIGAFFGVFVLWMGLAPLTSAVIARGKLVVISNEKVIQHLYGGTVAEILAREGDRVTKGQVLLRLDDKGARARKAQLTNRLTELLITQARWRAEAANLENFEIPSDLPIPAEEPNVASIIQEQTAVLQSRQRAAASRIDLMLGSIDQTKLQIQAYGEELSARRAQIELIDQELEGVENLYRKGLERKARVLALQRSKAGLTGSIGQLNGSLARAKQQINLAEVQILRVGEQVEQQAVENITRIESQLRTIREQLPVLEDQLQRLDVVAPRSGRVLSSKINTVGGVVAPGRAIMTLVPEDDELVVEAMIKPRDIDNLTEVTGVQVRLTSFNQRFTHPIEADLLNVSDSLVKGSGGPPSYRARIRLKPESLEKIIPDAKLKSGMPALALIGVGQQSLLFYLIEPLFLSFYLALTEKS